MTIIHATEVNYNVLTAEQFANDYPGQSTVNGTAPEGPVLVLTDDEDAVVAVIEGTNKAMLAELTGDINDLAQAEANPGKVEPKVGSSQTVLADR